MKALYALAVTAVILAACKSEGEPAEVESAPADAVAILVAAVQRASIRWEPVRRHRLARTINAPAELHLDPDRTAHVSSPVTAKIDEVRVRAGDHVTAGALLVVLRSADAGEARAALLRARASLDVARANVRRQDELRRAGIGAERTHEEAEAELRRLEAEAAAASQRIGVIGGRGAGATVELRAPIDGTILERHATVGENVVPETRLFTLADVSQVWVVGRVYERDVAAVQVGAQVRLTLEAYPGRTWEGAVAFVAAALDHDTRTLEVRLELANDGALRPGLFGSLSIDVPEGDETIAIPAAAVQRTGEKTFVFVHAGAANGRVRFAVRDVSLGREVGGNVEIASGLREGEQVVVNGAFTLKGELLRDSLAEEE